MAESARVRPKARSGRPAPEAAREAPAPSGPPDAEPDRPAGPDETRVSEQAPDTRPAGEESVRETPEDAWLDAERVGPRSEAP
jgi:hypothetical protein